MKGPDRSSQQYIRWRDLVFKRDNYTCQRCDRVGYLEAHHMASFCDNPDQRYVVQNGITFCVSCHEEFHKRYGKGNNNKYQVEQFIRRKITEMPTLF